MSGEIHPSVAGAQPCQRAERDPDAALFEGAYRDRFEKIITRYPDKKGALLPVLSMAQEVRGWLSPDTLRRVAELLELTPAYVRSVASFYTMFNLEPKGRHMIQVCTSIGCFLCDGERVLERFLEATGTRIGETSDDGLFTVVEVECLGACGFPTVVQINDRVYENVRVDDVDGILEELR